jgi:hypothetical protein
MEVEVGADGPTSAPPSGAAAAAPPAVASLDHLFALRASTSHANPPSVIPSLLMRVNDPLGR